MPESQAWLAAARSSHDRLKALVADLAPDEVTARSYAKEWTLAQVLSHLGSQAELFCLLLDAGLTGGSAPGQATMLPIWQRWDALPPEAQVTTSVDANERLGRRLEMLDATLASAFRVSAFGRELNFAGLRRSRCRPRIPSVASPSPPAVSASKRGPTRRGAARSACRRRRSCGWCTGGSTGPTPRRCNSPPPPSPWTTCGASSPVSDRGPSTAGR